MIIRYICFDVWKSHGNKSNLKADHKNFKLKVLNSVSRKVNINEMRCQKRAIIIHSNKKKLSNCEIRMTKIRQKLDLKQQSRYFKIDYKTNSTRKELLFPRKCWQQYHFYLDEPNPRRHFPLLAVKSRIKIESNCDSPKQNEGCKRPTS